MIIIPDVHGRAFWKEAVKGRENEEILFLGDYVDPYADFEEVKQEDGMKALLEIIDFKKQHAENVNLLIGNHDLSYIFNYMPKCRYDYDNENIIKNAFRDNLNLFNIAHEKIMDDRHYIFSHAGILPGWLKQNEDTLGQVTLENAPSVLNRQLAEGLSLTMLGDVSAYRGGCEYCGSCVWADVFEHFDYFKDSETPTEQDHYQVFGHTQLLSGHPIVTEHFACLDCRKAIELDGEGNFKEL